MSTSHHDPSAVLRAAMGPVARELLGEPNKALSSKDEWRFGNRGSVSVNLVKGTWADHSDGGKGGGVLDLVRARANLDKPAALNWLREHGHLSSAVKARTTPRGRIVAEYPYEDEAGSLLFQVCRFEPKNFRQRRPDLTKLDGWNWKTVGTRKVLFRLPQTIEAVQAGRTIYIAEGEKACLALVTMGLDATCSPGGAGKWRQEYNAVLAGANVVVLPDNDPQAEDEKDGSPRWHSDGRPVLPGQDHAADVAQNLKSVAKRVQIVMLPDLPLKGDAADWIAAGGTATLLEELCETDEAPAPEPPAAETDSLANFLSAEVWQQREFTPPVRLLGDLVTTTSRAFLVGSTGLGKTMFGMALAAGMASGQGFLDWRCDRPVRVLYVDGEMPGELVKARLRDATRRLNGASLQGNLFVYCADTADAFAAKFPTLGRLDALNKESGQNFIYALIDMLGGVDCVIFDNVMSLVAGDQKDEVPWSETLPLVGGLTSRNVGQIWFDHTGHNTARQYGSSTKAWRFDAVGVMTELPEEERAPRETAFKLSFDAPGKARRRTPDNWHEFVSRTIRLAEDRWSSERPDEDEASTGKRALGKVSPSRAVYHGVLVDALISNSTAPGTTTMAAWEAECVRRDLVDPPAAGEDSTGKRARTASFRAARSHLVTAGWVRIDGNRVSDLVGKYDRYDTCNTGGI